MANYRTFEAYAKAHFDVTDHLQDKGWITQDGSLLNVVAHDHLDTLFQEHATNPDAAVGQVLEAGFIRVGWSEHLGGEFIVHAAKPLTNPQRETLFRLIDEIEEGATLLVEDTRGDYSVEATVGNRPAISRALRGLNTALSAQEIVL